jgi:hypothetical protein
MNTLTPPPVPARVGSGEPGPDRLRLRLKQMSWATATVAATAWLCTFGPIACILSIAVAKHVLVAILAMGIDLDANSPRD